MKDATEPAGRHIQPRPGLRCVYLTEKGYEAEVHHELADLYTLDGADVEYAITRAIAELRRLDASRSWSGGPQR